MTVKTGKREGEELDAADREEVNLYKQSEKVLAQEVREDDIDTMPGKEVSKTGGEDQSENGQVSEVDEKRMDGEQYDREPEKDGVESVNGNGQAVATGSEDDIIYARPSMVFPFLISKFKKLNLIPLPCM